MVCMVAICWASVATWVFKDRFLALFGLCPQASRRPLGSFFWSGVRLWYSFIVQYRSSTLHFLGSLNKESIIDVQERVKKVFSIKTENNFTDYLGCEFNMNKDKKKRMVRTTIYYKEFGKKFSEEAMKHRLGLTPGTPRFIAMRVRLVMKKTNYQQRNMQHTEVGLVLCCISPNIADLIFAMQ